MKTKVLTICVLAAVLAIGSAAQADYFNGFETDIAGWDVFGGDYNASRVASGTDGITSKTGAYHGKADSSLFPATNWGGYSSVFPAGGYITSLDIYLGMAGDWNNDTRFDFTSAINNAAGNHRRDFAFNGGFYDDDGLGDRFIFSASNQTGRDNCYPEDPGHDPISITASGWYTFQHTFRDDGGVLAVDLAILDSSSAVMGSWTLSDPLDLVGSGALDGEWNEEVQVGGNRYGWFGSNEFNVLAFDNTSLTIVPEPATLCLLGLGSLALIRRRKRA